MFSFKRKEIAQTTIEYITLIIILTTVLYTMSPLMKRTIQSVIKISADQIGNQYEADQNFNSDVGYMDHAITGFAANSQKQVLERPNYQHNSIYLDATGITTNSLTTVGFTKEDK